MFLVSRLFSSVPLSDTCSMLISEHEGTYDAPPPSVMKIESLKPPVTFYSPSTRLYSGSAKSHYFSLSLVKEYYESESLLLKPPFFNY